MAVPETHTQSQLSLVFLNAVTTVAGFTVSDKTTGGDFGIDCSISIVTEYEGLINDAGVVLAVQLKATKNFRHHNGVIKYNLDIDSYRRLMAPCLQQKVLVVLTMPADPTSWVRCGHDKMLLERSAYFIKREDIPSFGNNRRSKVIEIPETNLLTPEAISLLAAPGLAKLEQIA